MFLNIWLRLFKIIVIFVLEILLLVVVIVVIVWRILNCWGERLGVFFKYILIILGLFWIWFMLFLYNIEFWWSIVILWVIWCINFILCLIIMMEWFFVRAKSKFFIFFVFLLVNFVIGLFINNKVGDWVINMLILSCCFLLWESRVVVKWVLGVRLMVFNSFFILCCLVLVVCFIKVF